MVTFGVVFWSPDECKSNIHSLLAVFGLLFGLQREMCVFSCYMLHCVHYLLANCVCLLFAAEVVYNCCLELFLLFWLETMD